MNARALVAEALGTFTLVGIGSLSIVSAGASSGLPPILTAPFGFGLALMAAIAIFGEASGGHFNPAVTLAAWIDRRLDWMNALAYVGAQIVGALAASFFVLVLFSKDVVDATRNVPNSVMSDPQAFAAEAVATAIFVAVILTVSRRQPDLAVLIIPLTLLLIHFALVPLTGSSVNPARSLAPAIVVGNYQHLWVYLTAPLVGSVLGWGVFRSMTPPEDELELELELDDEDLDEDLDDEDDAAAS